MSKQKVFVTIILMDLLSGMEFDLFVPSFPELQQIFNLTPFWLEMLLSINFIGYCLSLFFVGALADHYSRKFIILSGLSVFILGSTLCVWGTEYSLIILGRFLQGVGIAPASVLSFVIVADLYSLKEQQKILSILNAVINLAVGLAPVLGSYIALYFHWRGNFVALLILGIIVFFMACLFINNTNQVVDKNKKIHLIKQYSPIMRSKPLMLLIINLVTIFVPYWIFVGVSPILYMNDLGVSLSYFGYYQGVLAVIFAAGCLIFSTVVHRYPQKLLLGVAHGIFLISFIAIGIVTILDMPSPLLITLVLMIFVVGQIIPTAILYPLSLNYMPDAKGSVAALMQALRLVLTAISLQIAGHYYAGSFQNTGIILLIFIAIVIITNYLVIKNKKLMEYSYSKNINNEGF